MTIGPLPDLERLNRLYTAGFRDAFLDSALHKIVERQAARDEADLQRVTQHLREFEAQYGLSSGEFFQKYQAGQMADTADFTEWISYCKMRQRIVQRQQILQADPPMNDLLAYLTDIELALIRSPIIAAYQVVRSEVNTDDGYIRVRATLINDDFLEAAEYFMLEREAIVTSG